jgi:hypothetical protein
MDRSTVLSPRLKRFRRTLLIALGARHRPKPRAKIILAASIFFLSFAIKSLVAVDLSPVMHTTEQPAGGMTLEYEREALFVINNGIIFPRGWDPADTSLLVHAPGYAIFLGAVYAIVGRSYFSIQVIQNVLNSLSPVMLFLIAGMLVTWRVGAVAGLLAAASHHLSYYSNFILPDSLSALPVLVSVYLLVRARRAQARSSLALYALAGIMLGLSVWLRPNLLLMGPFLAILLPLISVKRWRTAMRAWVMALASFLVVLPITIRNYLIYDEFVPVSINLGIVLWEGLSDARGNPFQAPADDGEVARAEAVIYNDPRYAQSWWSPDGIKRDRDRVRMCVRIIAENPFRFAGLMLWRMREMLKYSAQAPLVFRASDVGLREAGLQASVMADGETGVSRRVSLAVGESISWARPAVRALQRVTKETSLLFILLGAPVLFALSRRRALFILMVPLYFFLIQSMMHTEFRYTLPMHYFLFVFAAVAWTLIAAAASNMVRRVSAQKPEA